jgi:hypothetical protein
MSTSTAVAAMTAASNTAKATVAPVGNLLKVLCIHGYSQSSTSFRGKTAALRSKFKSMAVFEYAQAPHVLSVEEYLKTLQNIPMVFKNYTTSSQSQASNASADIDTDSPPANLPRNSPPGMHHCTLTFS